MECAVQIPAEAVPCRSKTFGSISLHPNFRDRPSPKLVGPGLLLYDAERQHGICDFFKAGNVGAPDIVAVAVFLNTGLMAS